MNVWQWMKIYVILYYDFNVQCVIWDGDYGILVIIKDVHAIHALTRNLQQNIKVTVTQFQVKVGCLMTDDVTSSVEVDDEV